MDDETTLEQKRAEARQHKGVTYDKRIGLFTAAVTINGEKRYLGSFADAGDAALAYAVARDSQPIRRTRISSGRSVRDLMILFNDTAARDGNRHVVPGQVFTMPDGQRFRLEGFEKLRGRGWYIWSTRCRACGALFRQESTTALRNVTGLTRNCAQHRNDKSPGSAWPDPVEWATAPVAKPVEKTEKADAATLRAHDAMKDEVFDQIKGDADLEKEFYRIEREVELPFSWKYDEEHPGAGDCDWVLAWRKQPVDPYKELLARRAAPGADLV